MKCLKAYLVECEEKGNVKLTTPINNLRRHKCYGDFCEVKVKKIPHLSKNLLYFS